MTEIRNSILSLEQSWENSMNSVLRDARLEAGPRIARYGTAGFIELACQELKPGEAEIPYPLDQIFYEFKTEKNGALREVLFHIPVHGDVSIFYHLNSQNVRTRGNVDISSTRKDRIRLLYRVSTFPDVAGLHQHFLEDIDTLRNYLINVMAERESVEDRLRVHLKAIVTEIAPDIKPAVELAEKLEVLGYQRLPGNENIVGNYGMPSGLFNKKLEME